MAKILPSTVQAWVTLAVAGGLSARSVVKYHVMLHSIFKRAVRDRVIAFNPCADTELPKIVARKPRVVSPEEFDRLLSAVPARWQPLVLILNPDVKRRSASDEARAGNRYRRGALPRGR
jgi:site-specific recombinase XerD